MIELRWVYHDIEKGAPPAGSIYVSPRLYQKLQYREREKEFIGGKFIEYQSEWKDVKHPGVVE